MNLQRNAAIAMVAMLLAPASALADIDAGTLIDGHVQQDISSRNAQDGDRFTIRTDKGSTIYGHVSQVSRANIGRKAHLTLNFDRVRFPNGASEPISAKLVAVSKKSQVNYTRAAGTVLGGMVAGNFLGKVLGTNAGGALGVVGGGLLAANTASDIDVPQGATVQIQLTAPLITRRQAQ